MSADPPIFFTTSPESVTPTVWADTLRVDPCKIATLRFAPWGFTVTMKNGSVIGCRFLEQP